MRCYFIVHTFGSTRGGEVSVCTKIRFKYAVYGSEARPVAEGRRRTIIAGVEKTKENCPRKTISES